MPFLALAWITFFCRTIIRHDFQYQTFGIIYLTVSSWLMSSALNFTTHYAKIRTIRGELLKLPKNPLEILKLFLFGKKFLLEFFLWKIIPVDIFSLEISSWWNFFFGKKFMLKLCFGWNFLLKKLLWNKVPVEIITLEKSSWWNFQSPFRNFYMMAIQQLDKYS